MCFVLVLEMKLVNLCKVWYFYSAGCEDFGFLGCYSM